MSEPDYKLAFEACNRSWCRLYDELQRLRAAMRELPKQTGLFSLEPTIEEMLAASPAHDEAGWRPIGPLSGGE